MAKNGTTSKKILATRTSQLAVQLSDPEIRRAGERLAQLEGEVAAHVLKAKDVTDQLKSTRSSLDGQIHALAAIIRQGFEYRPVAVRVEADFSVKKVLEIREDTGEVIGERELNEQDRQASIFELAPKIDPSLEELRGEAKKSLARMNEAAQDLEKTIAERKAKETKPAPPPLEWRTETPGRDVAEVPGGRYALKTCTGGGYTTTWLPDTGKSKHLAVAKPLDEAKEACERHRLEAGADAILANAGDGELTKADTKGAAVARKKGRAHAG